MSAHPINETPVPALRAMLDEQLDTRELSRVLGLDDQAALLLARRVLQPPLADMLARPGKEVRARLVEHSFAVARAVAPCTCARLPEEVPLLVEMLHAGSLVVDDIEDEAVSRRGAPALHRTWGIPIALNAGNWLYFWPFLVLGSLPLDRGTSLAMHRRMSTTMVRCHQGQALDLAVRIHDLSQHEVATAVDATTRLKTGALMELSCTLGAIAAHAAPPTERALATFGREIGVALQMFDDLGCVLSPARRGKAEEDLVAARPTWPWAWLARSLDETTFKSLQRQASIAHATGRTDALLESLRMHCDSFRRKPREHLSAAIAGLRNSIGDHAPHAVAALITSLERDVRMLEHAYA